MKYVVLFQDRITKIIVDAKNESEASAKAQKQNKKMLVIACEPMEEKKMILTLLLCLLFMFMFPSLFSQTMEPEPFKVTWHLIVALLAGIYEVVARTIPTVKNYSFIAKIIEILLWLSNFLNRKKKK